MPLHLLSVEIEAAGSGLGASELKRIKELEAENAELKRMYAETSLERDALKKLLQKKLKGR